MAGTSGIIWSSSILGGPSCLICSSKLLAGSSSIIWSFSGMARNTVSKFSTTTSKAILWETVLYSHHPQFVPNYPRQDQNLQENNQASWQNNQWQDPGFQAGWQNEFQWQDPPVQSGMPPNQLPYSPCNPSPAQRVPPRGYTCAECQWRYQQSLPCIPQYSPCNTVQCPPSKLELELIKQL